jgi:BolA protein
MFDSQETARKLRGILEREFQPLELAIEDQSHLHRGHRQAGGGGHFFVVIRSNRFDGLSPLARQRLVLDSVQSLMDKEIHALSLRCLSVS